MILSVSSGCFRGDDEHPGDSSQDSPAAEGTERPDTARTPAPQRALGEATARPEPASVVTVRLGDQSVIGQTVTIDGVALSDGGTIGRIHWDWGDGTADEQPFPASHRFESLGHNYIVIATASDDRGGSVTAQTTVSITRATCANDPSRESAVPGLIAGRPAWADDRANIRVDHSATARRTGQIRGVSPDDRQVLVLDGPWCTEDFIWWHVESQAAALADGSGSIPQEGYVSGRLLGWMAKLDQEGRVNVSPEQATLGLPPASAPCPAWNLAADFRVSPDHENPNRDSCGNREVWHFLESDPSTFPAHIPVTYPLLPEFITDRFFIVGLESWQGTVGLTSIKDKLPSVGINNTGATQKFSGGVWPAGLVMAHPLPDKFAVVGWRSPISGIVTIAGE